MTLRMRVTQKKIKASKSHSFLIMLTHLSIVQKLNLFFKNKHQKYQE